jgi:3-carboxy-cis,cis-muconate cycloisomerase
MSVPWIDSLVSSAAMAAIFGDRSILEALLEFEAALARAEARQGLIPASAAEAIARAARAGSFDAENLAGATLRAGTPGIPLVKALTEAVRREDPPSAGFVHWGATSQDAADTAMALLLRRCRGGLAADHRRLTAALRRVSDEHAGTVMLGRTLLQAAPPVTFGLKAAGWLGALRRGWRRLERAFDEALVVQLGGASGTLAALGDRGMAVAASLAEELGLAFPDAPWHTHRDRFAALLAACAIYTGSLGKMARDIALLMQGEVGEVWEPGGEGRGGSSTMPHKRNPIACTLALAAAQRVPGLLAAFLAGLPQEHERGAGGWQAEWSAVAGVMQSTGLALESMREAAEGLRIDPARMRANLAATRGAVFAEKASMLLAGRMGLDQARLAVQAAAERSAAEGIPLKDALQGLLPAEELEALDRPEDYLGCAEEFRRRLLEQED